MTPARDSSRKRRVMRAASSLRAAMIVTVIAALSTLAAAPVRAQDPFLRDADAVFHTITHEYVLHPDGGTTYTYSHSLELLTPFAFNRAYGESFVTYNPAWQSLKILRSVTTMATGAKVSSPFNAFNEVLPGFAAGAAPYLGLREMVVTHTGLEEHCTVDFAYAIETKPGMFPGLMGRVLFGDRSPIETMTVRVKIPAGKTLAWSGLRMAAPPVEGTEGGMHVYTWTVSRIPMMPLETQQPPMDAALGALYFSTADVPSLVRHVVGDAPALYALDGAARAVVTDLVKRAGTATERAVALRRYVEQNVGFMSGDLQYVGYRPMKAQETWSRGVGSSLDRAVLLAAMCRAADLKAEPVLLGVPADAACLQRYTMACVRVTDAGGIILDPNGPQNGTLPPRFAGASILILAGEGETGVVAAADRNSITMTSDWSLSPGLALSGQTEASLRGAFECALEPARAAASLARTLSSAGPGVTAGGDHAEQSGDVTVVSASVTAVLKRAGSFEPIVFRLPAMPAGVDELHLNLGPTSRGTPVDVGAPSEQEFRMTLHLPDGVAPASIPAAADVSNAVGQVRCVMKADAHDIEIVKRLVIRDRMVPADRYGDLRALMRAWQDPAWGRLLLSAR